MIKQIYVHEAGGDNVRVWPLTPDGNYSVRSAYRMLAADGNNQNPSSSSPSEAKKVWKGIWKIKTPNKILHFVWRAAKDSLPTKQNLKARHIPLDDTCVMCDDQPKTLLHCLWLCSHAQSVWGSDITFANLYKKKHRSFFDLLDDVMQNSSGYCVALFSTIAWSLWQRRNQIRENQGTLPLHEVGDRAKALVVEFLEANKHIRNPSLRWVATIKVVVRDYRGDVMVALSHKIALPLLAALVEARAAHRAITFAQEMCFFRIQVEGDCLGVIHALQSQARCNTLYGHVADDTRRLSSALQSCQFHHIGREWNKLAHELARRAVFFVDTYMGRRSTF
ncbi:uncharacterized protein LOC126728544 [Quercus robur]|uniref:uncharacterized protein LOC126728544 n=1 Tax=Quercus robur TaxID=38942 RepID=UPI00216251BA|nr:uncharacterized protein LOC126728544 [Quercus robur]